MLSMALPPTPPQVTLPPCMGQPAVSQLGTGWSLRPRSVLVLRGGLEFSAGHSIPSGQLKGTKGPLFPEPEFRLEGLCPALVPYD